MASLSPASKRALANLRAFASPPTNWYKCPLTRRAAVLILLFADRKGDLRVVLTIRSAGLKNYAGQAALAGGKADTLHETPFAIARREAHEEIGLPAADAGLPRGYTLEHLAELPANLAMTELGVRPCVAYLRTPAPTPSAPDPDAARDILPVLDAREVAAVFTAPFYNFLRERDVDPAEEERVGGSWYKGSWHSWHETAWRMHQFFVPVHPGTVFLADAAQRKPPPPPAEKAKPDKKSPPSAPPRRSDPSSTLQPPLPSSFYSPTGSSNATANNDPLAQPRYRVFGMTARILVDCARVAYGEEPTYEHNSHFGDEDMIARLLAIGRLGEKRKEGEVLTREVMMEAKRAKI